MSVSSSAAPLAFLVCHPHSLVHRWNQIRIQSHGHDRGRGGVDDARYVHYARFRRCVHVCGVHDARDGLGGDPELQSLRVLHGQLVLLGSSCVLAIWIVQTSYSLRDFRITLDFIS